MALIQYRWSRKKAAGSEVWCGRKPEDLPFKKVDDLHPEIFASYSGPEDGLALVPTLPKAGQEGDHGNDKSSTHTDEVAGALSWGTKSRKAYGICMSLYDQHPINRKISGDPVADSFGVCARKNNCTLIVADGVNWGEKSKLAARCAVFGAMRFINEQLFKEGRTIKTTHDIFELLLESIHVSHRTILEHAGGLTTLCVAIVVPHRDSKKYIVCIVNVGDSLAYVFSKRHGVREITTGSHDIESERDIRDAGGAVGPVNGDKPELNNLTCSFTFVDRGDIVFLTSDGISDNFDPVVTKIAVARQPKTDDSDSKETTKTVGREIPLSADGRPEMAPHERHRYAVKEMERIIHEFELFTEQPCSAQELCGALLQHVLKLTDSKRKVLENPELYGKKLKAKERKKRDAEIVGKMKSAPGKLDHATVIGYEVGHYHGNDDEDYEQDSDEEFHQQNLSLGSIGHSQHPSSQHETHSEHQSSKQNHPKHDSSEHESSKDHSGQHNSKQNHSKKEHAKQSYTRQDSTPNNSKLESSKRSNSIHNLFKRSNSKHDKPKQDKSKQSSKHDPFKTACVPVKPKSPKGLKSEAYIPDKITKMNEEYLKSLAENQNKEIKSPSEISPKKSQQFSYKTNPKFPPQDVSANNQVMRNSAVVSKSQNAQMFRPIRSPRGTDNMYTAENKVSPQRPTPISPSKMISPPRNPKGDKQIIAPQHLEKVHFTANEISPQRPTATASTTEFQITSTNPQHFSHNTENKEISPNQNPQNFKPVKSPQNSENVHFALRRSESRRTASRSQHSPENPKAINSNQNAQIVKPTNSPQNTENIHTAENKVNPARRSAHFADSTPVRNSENVQVSDKNQITQRPPESQRSASNTRHSSGSHNANNSNQNPQLVKPKNSPQNTENKVTPVRRSAHFSDSPSSPSTPYDSDVGSTTSASKSVTFDRYVTKHEIEPHLKRDNFIYKMGFKTPPKSPSYPTQHKSHRSPHYYPPKSPRHQNPNFQYPKSSSHRKHRTNSLRKSRSFSDSPPPESPHIPPPNIDSFGYDASIQTPISPKDASLIFVSEKLTPNSGDDSQSWEKHSTSSLPRRRLSSRYSATDNVDYSQIRRRSHSAERASHRQSSRRYSSTKSHDSPEGVAPQHHGTLDSGIKAKRPTTLFPANSTPNLSNKPSSRAKQSPNTRSQTNQTSQNQNIPHQQAHPTEAPPPVDQQAPPIEAPPPVDQQISIDIHSMSLQTPPQKSPHQTSPSSRPPSSYPQISPGAIPSQQTVVLRSHPQISPSSRPPSYQKSHPAPPQGVVLRRHSSRTSPRPLSTSSVPINSPYNTDNQFFTSPCDLKSVGFESAV